VVFRLILQNFYTLRTIFETAAGADRVYLLMKLSDLHVRFAMSCGRLSVLEDRASSLPVCASGWFGHAH